MFFFRVWKKKPQHISFTSLSLCPERHRIELEKFFRVWPQRQQQQQQQQKQQQILEFGLDGRLCDV